MHDIFRNKFLQYFKMLISIKIIKLLNSLSCNITSASPWNCVLKLTNYRHAVCMSQEL